MAKRLGVASLGVAVLALLTSPLIAMFPVLIVGVAVVWRLWVEHKNAERGILAPPENDSEIN